VSRLVLTGREVLQHNSSQRTGRAGDPLNYPDQPGPAGSQLTAEVATSLPAVSADGKTYTFTIRDGFRFSPPSNAPVTAETFQHAIERSLSPEMKSPLDYQFGDIVGAAAYMAGKAPHISGVSAQGNKLAIRLLAPDGDLPARMAEPVFCAIPDNTPNDSNGLPAIPMAGPYYIASYAPGNGVVLERNPNYQGSRSPRSISPST
jgi:ABC-type transport system substrate-binding protein